MIKCEDLAEAFKKHNLTFFTGVPDSTFKGWMSFLNENNGLTNRVVANEGDGVHHAGAYYLATSNPGVVYMQNAGLGNVVNPITSYADAEVYSLPMLLMIGWRGEPNTKDEPQHIKMGRVTTNLLDTLEIPWEVLPSDTEAVEESIAKAASFMQSNTRPYALIVRKDVIEEYKGSKTIQEYEMTREDALKLIVDSLGDTDIIVSTTGKTSRELFEYREEKSQGHERDFLNVGGMGGVSSQSLELALQQPNRRVFAFDGDGAILMHAGTLATIGNNKPKNLYHIVFDNESYESTGGQPTVSTSVNFPEAAKSFGYADACQVETRDNLLAKLKDLKDGPQMIVVKVKKGSREDLGRPTTTPAQNKEAFMGNLNDN